MRVGLISYHSEPNYGTMLQAYALAKALGLLGVECEYLRYYNIPKPSILYTCVRSIVRFFIPAKKGTFDFFDSEAFKDTKDAFDKFHDTYIPCSKAKYYSDTVKDSNSIYDLFVVGSDQTWSEYMNRFATSANFLEFVLDSNKKASYAPSIGSLTISDSFKHRLILALSSFRHLSCREEPNARMLSKELGKDVKYVIDPTLLLSPDQWNELAVAPELPRKKYVLAYILGEKQCISDYAEKLGDSCGLPVYYVLTRPMYLEKNNCLTGVGPSEFIGLIRDAAYVVTDSFHGTAFCLNYGTQVYSFTKRPSLSGEKPLDNDRIRLLLEEFNLSNRMKDDSDSSLEKDYDPNDYLKKLESFRESSADYLRTIVK